MNLKTLKNLLNEAQVMMPNVSDTTAGNDFKNEVLQAMEHLFPDAQSSLNILNRLDFEPSSQYPSGPYDWSPYFDSKKTIIAILKAKVQHLTAIENEEKKLESKKVNSKIESLSSRIDSLNKNITDSIAREAQTKLQLTNLTMEISEKESLITSLTSENKNKGRMRVFKDISVGATILSGAFILGGVLGNAKFDNDKINMADKIRTDKTTIDSLKNIIKKRNDSIQRANKR